MTVNKFFIPLIHQKFLTTIYFNNLLNQGMFMQKVAETYEYFDCRYYLQILIDEVLLHMNYVVGFAFDSSLICHDVF